MFSMKASILAILALSAISVAAAVTVTATVAVTRSRPPPACLCLACFWNCNEKLKSKNGMTSKALGSVYPESLVL
jgi:hypothetical protein